jgi:hypothetical protein
VTRAAVVLVLLVGAAGCGSQAKKTAPPRQPHLPRALAQSWAEQADAVASALASGDGCTALSRATALQTTVIAAVNDGKVPARFQEALTSSVNDLASRVTCTPTPPQVVPEPKPSKPHDRKPPKKPHGHGEKKGHKKK